MSNTNFNKLLSLLRKRLLEKLLLNTGIDTRIEALYNDTNIVGITGSKVSNGSWTRGEDGVPPTARENVGFRSPG